MVDGAMCMAFLPYLRELKQGVSDPEPCPYRQIPEIKPFYYDVFSERAEIDIGASLPERFYFLKREKTDLTVPFTCMGISLDSPFRNEFN